MSFNDVYQVALKMNYKGQQKGMNVFYYQQTSATVDDAIAMSEAFKANVVNDVRGIMTSDIFLESLEVKNLFDVLDFVTYAYPANTTGARSGSSEPPFVSVRYKVARARADMRDGGKRFWGVSESDIEDSEILPASLGPFNSLLNKLNDTLTAPAPYSGTFDPIIVKRIPEIVDGKKTYRLPKTQGELIYYRIQANISLITTVTSQISRKKGKGI